MYNSGILLHENSRSCISNRAINITQKQNPKNAGIAETSKVD